MPMPNDQKDEFLEAFNEEQVMPAEPSEDEAFGLSMPEDGTSDTGGSETAVVIAPEPPAEETQPGPTEEAPAQDAVAAADATQGGDEPQDPKELQRMKSWEGRLRAKERELAAREEAMKASAQPPQASEQPKTGEAEVNQDAASEAIEQAAEKMAADGDTAGAQAVGEVADKVESGEMTAEQAMKMLSEDFGEDFVGSIRTLVNSLVKDVAGKEIGRLDGTINKMISEITDERARSHFEAIADAHPDFNEIPQEKVESYIASLPEEKRGDAQQAVTKGTTRQVIKFLNDMKAWEKSQSSGQDEQVDSAAESTMIADAEGVRSTGLRLPTQPSRSDDYDQAWNEF